VFTSKDGATNTGWRVTATPLTRRSSTRHEMPETTTAKRFGIESSYRLAKQSLAFTSSQDAGLRLVMFVVSLLLQNSWRYLHWRYVAAPRRGGAASGDGRSRSSVRWCCGQPGQRLVCAGLFQRTNHSTTGSSGSCPPLGTAIVSGDTVASAAVRRRQRPLTAETHRPCHFEN